MIGDRWRDIEAGSRAGCKTFFIDYGYDERAPQSYDFRVSSLLEATRDHLASGHIIVTTIDSLKIKIFADGADTAEMLAMNSRPFIKGLTTNPTLMRKGRHLELPEFRPGNPCPDQDKPLSFEVVGDEFAEMEQQALEISSWGDNVYVKIPSRIPAATPATASCAACESRRQTQRHRDHDSRASPGGRRCPQPEVASFVSVLAGRIADTGGGPRPVHDGRRPHARDVSQGGAHLGKPARSAQHRSGRQYRLPYRDGNSGHPDKLPLIRIQPRRVFARHRADVLSRRCCCRVLPMQVSRPVLPDDRALEWNERRESAPHGGPSAHLSARPRNPTHPLRSDRRKSCGTEPVISLLLPDFAAAFPIPSRSRQPTYSGTLVHFPAHRWITYGVQGPAGTPPRGCATR